MAYEHKIVSYDEWLAAQSPAEAPAVEPEVAEPTEPTEGEPVVAEVSPEVKNLNAKTVDAAAEILVENEAGGWELVAVTQHSDGDPRFLFFKRQA
jgi:hypothetical protein